MDDENRDLSPAEEPAAEPASPPEPPTPPEPPAAPGPPTTPEAPAPAGGSEFGTAVESTARDFAEGAKSAWSELTGASKAEQPGAPESPTPTPPTEPAAPTPTPPSAPVVPPGRPAPPPPPQEAAYGTPASTGQPCPKSRVTAGILGILLGGLGVHKFYLGYTTPGIIMVVVWLVGWATMGVLSFAVSVVGLIEGIMYLTKTDDEFCAMYVYGKKEWF